MPRDYKVFLQDVLDAIANIAVFAGSMSRPEFEADKKTLHAVVRNREVIGEAIKSVPPEVSVLHPRVAWQRIAGLRDILIHHYCSFPKTGKTPVPPTVSAASSKAKSGPGRSPT